MTLDLLAQPQCDAMAHLLAVEDHDPAQLRAEFERARPFPHVVIDEFVRCEPVVSQQFPGREWPHWEGYGDIYQARKSICSDLDVIPRPFSDIIRESATPRFLEFLESLTGVQPLIPDPYLAGGGLHASGGGGVLMPHTDFHLHRVLEVFRQLNVLIYLNETWELADGGCLELFGDATAKRPEVTVVPAFGRTVIFRTDNRSVHGFPTPVADGRRRQSIALYYYTAAEERRFAGDSITYWRHHGDHRGTKRVQASMYSALVFATRAVSRLAFEVNPNVDHGRLRRLRERVKR